MIVNYRCCTYNRLKDVIIDGALITIEDIIDVQDDTEHDNDLSNTTFLNPSQTDKPAGEKMFKCEICDFATSSKKNLIDHKEAIHNWCSTCYSSFKNQEKLKNHTKKKHAEKSKLTGLTPGKVPR